jgi:hypothetical protein
MSEQRVAVPLLEGVFSSAEALALSHTATIGGIECRLRLPREGPRSSPLRPPDDEEDLDLDWARTRWGHPNGSGSVTIQAVGLILVSEPLPWGYGLTAFDQAVAGWKHSLRDWLSVIAGGPTDFLELAPGETRWASEDHNMALWGESYDYLHEPERVSRWEWEHVLAHIRSGDQPPLARVLLTTAARAAATSNWRVAVIDAATAAEVALTTGLTAHLSAEASSQVVRALIERTRMLGPRLDLAKDLGMTLPARIHADLLEQRNAVIHRGTEVTETAAQAAIAAAWELVDEYEPLAAHCQEPSDPDWEPRPLE